MPSEVSFGTYIKKLDKYVRDRRGYLEVQPNIINRYFVHLPGKKAFVIDSTMVITWKFSLSKNERQIVYKPVLPNDLAPEVAEFLRVFLGVTLGSRNYDCTPEIIAEAKAVLASQSTNN